ncbi:MAG: hypothetical protein SGPRY_011654, partial [Prymnesium sp.]
AHLPELAEEWLDRMEQAGIVPNVISFSSAISAYAKTAQPGEAGRLLKRMRSRGIKPDTVTINNVIDAQARAGNVQQAVAWLNRTRRGEFPEAPADVVSYTIVISALSRSGKLPDARRWLDIMIASGVKPDLLCYNTLVVGMAGSCRWNEIDALLRMMRADGVQPDQWTYGPLLEACRRSGDKRRSRRIGKKMFLSPGTYSSFCLISLRRSLGQAQFRALCCECGVEELANEKYDIKERGDHDASTYRFRPVEQRLLLMRNSPATLLVSEDYNVTSPLSSQVIRMHIVELTD